MVTFFATLKQNPYTYVPKTGFHKRIQWNRIEQNRIEQNSIEQNRTE